MPQALLKVTKDTRNHALWQPNDKSLRNVEVDEAGKLAAFRDRFGRSWDQEKKKTEEEEEEEEAAKAEVAADKGDQAKKVGKDGEPAGTMADKKAAVPVVEEAVEEEDGYDSLVDLISGYASGTQDGTAGGMTAKELEKKEKAELAAKVAARKAGKAK